MPKTHYLSDSILNYLSKNGDFTQPESLYVALFTAMPGAGGGGTEVSGGGYARQPVAFSQSSSGEITNNAKITFPDATANWGTIVGVGIFDSSTEGNLLCYDYLTQARQVLLGDSVYFNAGDLSWKES